MAEPWRSMHALEAQCVAVQFDKIATDGGR